MNSLWLNEKIKGNFPKLEKNLETQVCIIGAGIFGISTAYYLTQKGYSVTILERDKIVNRVTGHTTAKITSQHGLIYHYLLNQYGKEFARNYYLANQKSIQEIEKIITQNQIDCDFERQSSCVYTINQSELEKLNEELQALKELDIETSKIKDAPLPFENVSGVEFKNQAQFNPVKYIDGLVKKIIDSKGKIFENTTCYDIKRDGDTYICYTENNTVNAKYVVLASHYPFINFPGVYFAKMYQSSSYVIGIDAKSEVFDGMYINIQSPIYSFRTAKDRDKKILLLGGGDHKTGENICYKDSYGLLEEKAKRWYPNCEIKYRWSTRDCITLDKIPYIGEFSNTLPDMYVGTGFNKWGMTSSNIAARIVTDKITGKENEYIEIFEATRLNPIVNKDEVKNMVSQTVKSLVVERIEKSEKVVNDEISLDDIKQETGQIIEWNGEKVGVYKDIEGKIFAVKPVCTHLGCILNWNDAEKTWDCPCHGSRFDYTGKNMYNPALKDLEKFRL